MPEWIAIAAMAENRVIGNGSEIPWHLPEDFKFFKQTTMGHILVMGRKTYESIGRPLPGRKTIVVSRQSTPIDGVQVINDLSDLEGMETDKTIFIAGGSEIYAQTLPKCQKLYLTHVKGKPSGDIHFPAFESNFERIETLKETDAFEIIAYRNISALKPTV